MYLPDNGGRGWWGAWLMRPPTLPPRDHGTATLPPRDHHVTHPRDRPRATAHATRTRRWDWHGGAWLRPGQAVTLPAPLGICPLLARGGSLVLLAEGAAAAATADSAVSEAATKPPRDRRETAVQAPCKRRASAV